MENWNITTEVMRREYGFSDRAEIRARDSNPFHKSILGSYYIVKKILAERIIGEVYTNPKSLDFNAKGDLLCIGYCDKEIAIYNWAHNKLKFCFNSEHKKEVTDVKLTNNDGNSLIITTTGNDGQIRRAHIRPTGEVVSTFLYHHEKGRPKLAAVPRSPYEFVAVTTNGMILQLDLRCNPIVLPTIKHMPHEDFGFLRLYDVAHHPFAAEFCVGGCDAFLRIFDRRKMTVALKEMYPEGLKDFLIVNILQCTYNYDGSEILANYSREGAYLFDHQRYSAGEYLRSFRISSKRFEEASFFGPKSEFVICAEADGVYVFDKNTEEMINFADSNAEYLDMEYYPNYICSVSGVRSHPFLPIMASKTSYKGVILWAPAEEKENC